MKRVTDIVGEISSASEEQRTGIEQVNQAVSQMDQVTQQNAALVEEASAAAQSMADQAVTLREAVAVFRVADTGVVIPRNDPHRLAPEVPTSLRATSAKVTPVDTAARSTVVAPDTAAADWKAF